nr:hypothetical protein GCM10020185_40650 [Pseudomonas brassicacearum subsp. brassicacearum]
MPWVNSIHWPLAFGVVRVAVAGIEARHVQGAMVQQVAVGLGIARIDALAADEFVDELTALIIAHVHHGATVIGLRQGGVFRV